MDFTRVFTTFGIRSRVIYGRTTFLKVTSSEVIFDTFGFQAAGVVDLLRRVQRVTLTNVMLTKYCFATEKGIAAQLVARLPSIFV